MDDLVEDILLRLPPGDPASLVHAALVCRRWRRLVSGPRFRRRYREFHRTLPMLGFLYRHHDESVGSSSRFKPTSSFHPPDAGNIGFGVGCRAVDSRHGRVLFYTLHKEAPLIVWDPITGEERTLPVPPCWPGYRDHVARTAALVCTAGACDHLDCPRGGPFLVVFTVTDYASQDKTTICLYKSEADAWGGTARAEHTGDLVMEGRNALVGNALYLQLGNSIIEYHLGTHELSVMSLPAAACKVRYVELAFILTPEDGGLGVAAVDGFNVHMWSRDGSGPNATWTHCRVIDLRSLLPAGSRALITPWPEPPYVIAFAEGTSIVFLWDAGIGTCAVDLKSGEVTKIHDSLVDPIVPYKSFCTPALRSAQEPGVFF